MLKKLSDIEINSDSPFGNDALNRQQSIEILTRLIESTHQPFVLSIEAPWGFGKTTFIRLWKAHLESKGHVCLYFNAWENDFVDDPLVAFLGEMTNYVEKVLQKEVENEPLKASWEKVKRIGGGVLRRTLPLAIQIATHGLLHQKAIKEELEAIGGNADKIGEFASTLANDRLKKYEEEKRGIIGFREGLETLAIEITKDAGNKTPLVFFVDELDRCRPDFAVALLERIKHLFNVKNVIFILAIDRGQLDQSVKALYGTDMKPDGYLRRFIDLSYRLPEPDSHRFALNLFDRFALSETGTWYGTIEHFLVAFAKYSRAFGLSLRAQEQCFIEMNIALRNNPMIRNFPYTLAFLSTIKAFRPTFGEEIRERRLKIETVLEWVEKTENSRCVNHAEASLLVKFQDDPDAVNRLKDLRRLAEPRAVITGDGSNEKRAREILVAMQNLNEWTPNATESILLLLNLSAGFR